MPISKFKHQNGLLKFQIKNRNWINIKDFWTNIDPFEHIIINLDCKLGKVQIWKALQNSQILLGDNENDIFGDQ